MGEMIAADITAVKTALCAVLFVRLAVLFHICEGVFLLSDKGGTGLTKGQDKTAWATEQLCTKYKELGRTPKKEDFDDKTRSKIKAFLGPWPRALEKAGLKESVKSEKNKKRKDL